MTAAKSARTWGALAGASVLIWVSGCFCQLVYDDGETYELRLGGADLIILWGPTEHVQYERGVGYRAGFWFADFVTALPWLGLGDSSTHDHILAVPLWPVPVALIVQAIRRHRAARRKPSACRQCGYNLTGNVSGRCPECGTRI